MVINHNLGAMNAQRNMGINSGAASKSMEKLSSGLKINRAGDDAAGLSISEKMRAQIRGLDQASTNAEDGISMIQTAEGALNETHSILQRMRELSVQAGNDTNADTDRAAIQEEINQLTSEINRIGNTTEFNTQKLLNGDKETGVKTLVKGEAAKAAVTEVKGVYAATVGTADLVIGGKTFTYDSTGDGSVSFKDLATLKTLVGNDAELSAAYTIGDDGAGKLTLTQKVGSDTKLTGDVTETTAGVVGEAAVVGTASKYSFTFDSDAEKVTIGSDEFKGFKNVDELVDAINAKYTTNGYSAAKSADGKSIELTEKGTQVGTATAPTVTGTKDNSVKLQIGANENQSMSIEIDDMRSDALGLVGTGKGFTKESTVTDGTNNTNIQNALDVSTAKNAGNATTIINNAIETVSKQRSSLGAYQNRLEHTINNLNTSSENLTAAESRIRDTDMASEMSEYSKNNILQQAAQAMLAQAKSAPEQVLQLLR